MSKNKFLTLSKNLKEEKVTSERISTMKSTLTHTQVKSLKSNNEKKIPSKSNIKD
jgi:hypothetical protein